MKKDKKINNKDFDVSLLPTNRKDQFKDIIKNNFSNILSSGAILLLFSIPLFLIIILKTVILSNIGDITQEGATSAILIYSLIFDGCAVLGFVLFFVGLSGINKVIKILIFNDNLMFKTNFKEGIKENYKQYMVVGLVVGIFLLIFNLTINVANLTGNNVFTILAYVFIGVVVFFFAPILLMMLPLIATYKNNFGVNFKNAYILSIKYYIPYILITLTLTVTAFILFILYGFINSFIVIAIMAFLVLYALPVFLIGNFCYAYFLFDKHINTNYPEILNKGLYDPNAKKEVIDNKNKDEANKTSENTSNDENKDNPKSN